MGELAKTIVSQRYFEGIDSLPWVRTSNFFVGQCKKCKDKCEVIRSFSNYDGQFVTKCLSCINKAFEGGFLKPNSDGEILSIGELEIFPREWKSGSWPFYCSDCKKKTKFIGKSKPDDFGEILFDGSCEFCGIVYSGIRQELWENSNKIRLLDN